MIDMTEFSDNALPERLFPIIRDLSQGQNNLEIAGGVQDGQIGNLSARMNGDSHYFFGEFTFTGTPSNLVVPSFTNVAGAGIDYNSGWLNFGYLGVYLFHVELTGSCANSRSDWYQEVSVFTQNQGAPSSIQGMIFNRLPPSGTWNMQSEGDALVAVNGGDRWQLLINTTALGVVSAGKVVLRVKKVV